MRIRERNSLSTVQSNITVTNGSCLSGNNYSTGLVDAYVVGERQTTGDLVTLNYGKRRAMGEIIMNPFVSKLEKFSCSLTGPTHANINCGGLGFTSTYKYNDGYINKAISVNQTFSLFSPTDIEDATAAAAAKAWEAVRREELQLLVFLAEIKQTISMLRNPIQNFQRFLTKVRNIKNSSGKAADRALTTAQYIAREWLTYRFGWSQLYRDVYNAVKALEKDERTGMLRSFGNYSIERNTDDDLTVDPDFTSTFNLYFNRRRTHRLRVRAGVYFKGSRSTHDYLGLTPEAILDAAWELIPYSFVADWALWVGTYLKGLINQLSVDKRGSFTTVTHERTCVYTCTGAVIPAGSHVIVTDAGGASTWYSREKTRKPGILPPSLVLDLKIKDFLDLRVLDGLALIVNIAGRK